MDLSTPAAQITLHVHVEMVCLPASFCAQGNETQLLSVRCCGLIYRQTYCFLLSREVNRWFLLFFIDTVKSVYFNSGPELTGTI